MKHPFPHLIVALDMEGLTAAKALVKRLGSKVSCYKVGMKLFTRYGPEVIKWLHRQKKQTFLDLKFHDIPNTVAEACREATRLKVTMLTLHASGGLAMMKAAVRAVKAEAKKQKLKAPKLLGVTVLTSMDDLTELGIRRSIPKQVEALASLANRAGLDGVVCSPWEIKLIRKTLGKKALIVTPGVRPLGSAAGDQKRIKTPQQAWADGAEAVVMGRPVYGAKNPVQVVESLLV